MLRPSTQTGFTLLELVMVLAVAAILVAVGMPDFSSIAEKRRLQGSAQRLQQDMMLARTEAIKRNTAIAIQFSGAGADWCYGLTDTPGGACDCEDDPPNCTIDGVEVVRNSEPYPGVAVDSVSFDGERAVFNPPNGTLTTGADEDSLVLGSDSGVQATVLVSALGRVLVCSDTGGQKYGFQSCP